MLGAAKQLSQNNEKANHFEPCSQPTRLIAHTTRYIGSRALGAHIDKKAASPSKGLAREKVKTGVQEELRQEHADRVSAQALVEQHQQQLADLKLEASVLRHASAEHAR